jgi:predicted peroxiredoxin
VYKGNVDLFFYVVGSAQENELMLTSVLTCLYDAANLLLRKNVEKRILLRHIDSVFLIVDEIVDGGVIMAVDEASVLDQIVMRGDDIPLTEQSISQVLQSAKDQIKWSLLK